MRKALLIVFAMTAFVSGISAQQYTGLEGLLHCPSADMHLKGTGRVALSFLNRNSLPEHYKYNVIAYSLAYNPFDWAEISFTGLVRKAGGTIYQDRMASFKFRPVREGKWWPSVVIGSNDPLSTIRTSTDSEGNNMMCNFYLALSKHIETKVGTIGLHAAYRKFRKTANAKWNGFVGGVTFSPCFYPDARIVAEYDGAGFNIGMDIKVLKHLYLQAICYGMRCFNGGICFEINL